MVVSSACLLKNLVFHLPALRSPLMSFYIESVIQTGGQLVSNFLDSCNLAQSYIAFFDPTKKSINHFPFPLSTATRRQELAL